MAFPINDILALIPQKPPFVFIDRLLFVDDIVTRSSFTILPGTLFLKNNFLQEAGLLENIAQTAALRAGYTALTENRPVEEGYIGSVNNFEIFALPKVNDQLITEVYITDNIFNVTILNGKIWHQAKLIAACQMKVFVGNSNG